MPESTAVRVALWRALHLEVDPPPHVLEDQIGLRLAAPDDGWRHRPDMDPAVHEPLPSIDRGPPAPSFSCTSFCPPAGYGRANCRGMSTLPLGPESRRLAVCLG